jgi:hypothetical protein
MWKLRKKKRKLKNNNNMYDIIGNVTDESNLPIDSVVVDNGAKSVKTDAKGYYELKSEFPGITFKKDGYLPYTFDLSTKYKDGASVNLDAKLKKDTNYKPNDKPKKNLMWLYIGLGVLVLGVGGYFAYKKFGK